MSSNTHGKLGGRILLPLIFLLLLIFYSPQVYAEDYAPRYYPAQRRDASKRPVVEPRDSQDIRGEGQSGECNDDPNLIFIPLVIREAGSPQQNVQITSIFYDGEVPQSESDEYAEVTNQGLGAMNLEGWRLNAGSLGQDFNFPNFVIDPGQTCRVYTNELHPESCGFSFASGVALWQNGGDCGYLYNQAGDLISTYCY